MKIGIILHSHTGNTLSVGEKLKEALNEQGHTIQLEKVTAVNEDPGPRDQIVLKSIPKINEYDVIIFGSPVRAFSLSPIMSVYLSQLADLSGKKLVCFVTEQFPNPWMGGNQAIKKMIRIITQKNGRVSDTGVINWSSKSRDKQIDDILKRFTKVLQQ